RRGQQALAEFGAVDGAADADARKQRIDRHHGVAGIKLVHRLVRREGRNAVLCEHVEHGGLAGGDRSGEPEFEHQSVASILARRSAVTSGRTPNQASKPGTAWCSNMPRPSTVLSPMACASSKSGVSKGT